MVCPCCNKPVAEATDHNQDAGSTTSQPKSDKKNNRGNKKGRMRMRSPSCHNVDSYSVTFTDMKLFSDKKVSTVIYQRAN